MEEIRQFVASLRAKGVKITSECDDLRVEAVRGSLQAEDLARLREAKAAILELLGTNQSSSSPVIPKRASWRCAPLTPSQFFWWKTHLARGTRLSRRVSSFAMRVLGNAQVPALERSIGAVIDRHESLRTRFPVIENAPVQLVDNAPACSLNVIDLSNAPAEQREADAARIIDEFVNKPVDVAVGPLFEAMLLELSDEDRIVVLALDHLIVDGISRKILADEILTYYDHFDDGQELPLAPMSIQMGDYAVWLSDTHDNWRRRNEAHWQDRLANAPLVRYPRDAAIVAASSQWDETAVALGPIIGNGLHGLARRERTTVALAVFTICIALLSRWFTTEELVVGLVSNGRWSSQLENVIGFIANILHLRIKVAKSDTFNDLLRQVNTEYRSALEHQDFSRMLEAYRGYEIDLAFNWLDFLPVETQRRPKQAAHLKPVIIEPYPVQPTIPAEWLDNSVPRLSVLCSARSTEITCKIIGSPGIFRPYNVDQYAQAFRSFVEVLVETPDAPMPLLSIR